MSGLYFTLEKEEDRPREDFVVDCTPIFRRAAEFTALPRLGVSTDDQQIGAWNNSKRLLTSP